MKFDPEFTNSWIFEQFARYQNWIQLGLEQEIHALSVVIYSSIADAASFLKPIHILSPDIIKKTHTHSDASKKHLYYTIDKLMQDLKIVCIR